LAANSGIGDDGKLEDTAYTRASPSEARIPAVSDPSPTISAIKPFLVFDTKVLSMMMEDCVLVVLMVFGHVCSPRPSARTSVKM